MFSPMKKIAIAVAIAVLPLTVANNAFAFDADTAQATAKQNGCFKCHAIDKKKDGPAYRDIAAKYKAKDHAESVKRLITHITTGEMAKFPDGHEEEHKIIKINDVAVQTNLVEWILSLPGGKWPAN